MEPYHSWTLDSTIKPKVTSFFPLRKLKGTQPTAKIPATQLTHFEEEAADEEEGSQIKDPEDIEA